MKATVGMKTNGVGKPVDWLNHTRSMADDPAIKRAREALLGRRVEIVRRQK